MEHLLALAAAVVHLTAGKGWVAKWPFQRRVAPSPPLWGPCPGHPDVNGLKFDAAGNSTAVAAMLLVSGGSSLHSHSQLGSWSVVQTACLRKIAYGSCWLARCMSLGWWNRRALLLSSAGHQHLVSLTQCRHCRPDSQEHN